MKLAGGKKRNRRKKKEKHRMLRSGTTECERQVRAGLGQRDRKELKNNRQRERERERGERQIRSRTTARELCCEPALKSLFYATEVVSSPMDTLSPDSAGK